MKVGTYIEVLDSRTTLDWTLCVMCRCNGENSTFSWAAVTPSDNIPILYLPGVRAEVRGGD